MRRATYRLQMRAEFGFDDAAAVTDYLGALGVSDVYCSPLLQATDGSTHGYDVVDHSRLSSDLGGEAGFGRFRKSLDESGLGLTVDIVPNHMAIGTRANRWWWDVLENGPSSPYARYFDIDWPGDGGRPEQTVLVPVLGDRYGRILDAGQIQLVRDGGAFTIRYFDNVLPVSPRTLDTLLQMAGGPAAELAGEFADLPAASVTDPAATALRHERKETLRQRLAALLETDRQAAEAVDRAVSSVNSNPDELDRLLRRQNYRLAFWRTASEELDYRRFFNIETLVGLRVEDDQVFADTHETIGRLVREGAVTGLRVDHVDGLRDPEGYLQRLRRLAPGAYVVVEKILDPDERMPAEWPVQGTTGYDFITRVNNAFVDPSGEEALTGCYSRLTGETSPYSEVVRAAKLQIMSEELAPEVERLTRLLHGICDGNRSQRDRTRHEVNEALKDLLASFPVYRTYAQPDRPVGDEDVTFVERAVRSAQQANPSVDPDLFGFIGELLLLRHPGGPQTEFALSFPQVSAPVMAKGAEDTAFYRYNRLIALNEVGGNPGQFGQPLSQFHAGCAEAAERFPEAMLTLATHDTKRSPDVRARISLLSEVPASWESAVASWLETTDRHAGDLDPNTRYLLLQTLVGAWPIGADRLHGYMEKAVREAKVATAWTDVNEAYEEDLHRYIDSVVADREFVTELERWLNSERIVELGRQTSLSQTALLLTCPGVPDLYQGTETWDDSLVDPDNRRPVDYVRRRRDLEAVSGWQPGDLALKPADDLAKTFLVASVLAHRARRPAPFTSNEYDPLPVEGDRADHVIAFSRGGLVVVAARHLAKLGGDWGDTRVKLPSGSWQPVAGAPGGATSGGSSAVGDLLGGGPVAILEG